MDDTFSKQFAMDFFLENDSVASINRFIVAMANVIKENNDNIADLNYVISKEYYYLSGVHCSYKDKIRKKLNYKSTLESRKVRTCTKNMLDFDNQFKMRKSTIEALVSFFKSLNIFDCDHKLGVSLDKKVHIFLCIMITNQSYSEIARSFNVHKKTVSRIFIELSTALADHIDYFIKWPQEEQQHATRIKVSSQFNFPNCVGFIDACQLSVDSKRGKNPDKFLLQAVCNESLLFTHIHIGNIGVVSKKEVYKDSLLEHNILKNMNIDDHLLGSADYEIQKNLITPYTKCKTFEEKKFNAVHMTVHSYISQAFHLLQSHFTRLHKLEVETFELCKIIVFSACVLHNFILVHEKAKIVKEERVSCKDVVTIDTNIVKTAADKREFLCKYINCVEKPIISRFL